MTAAAWYRSQSRAISAEEVCRSLDTRGVALRGGYHCAQPLVRAFGVDGAARASLAPYSVDEDVDALLAGLEELVGTRSARASRRSVEGASQSASREFAGRASGCRRQPFRPNLP